MSEKARVDAQEKDPPWSDGPYDTNGKQQFDSLEMMTNRENVHSEEEKFDEEAVITSKCHPEVKIARTLESLRHLQQQSEPPPRRRLSQQEVDLLKKTSFLLTNEAAVNRVMSQTELKRLKEFNLKYSNKRSSIKSSAASSNNDDDGRNHVDVIAAVDNSKEKEKKLHHLCLPLEKSILFQKIIRKQKCPTWYKQMRLQIRKIIKTKQWRWMIVFCVFVDIFVLAADSEKKKKDPNDDGILWQLDLFFTCIFAMEIIFKMIAYGIYHQPNSYLKQNRFRSIHVFIIACSFVSYRLDESWRVLRGLKTFRCLSLFSGLRRIVKSLVYAIPFLANVGTMASFFLLAFSMFGYEAFRDSYEYQCSLENPDGFGGTLAAIPRNFCSRNDTCAPNNQICLPQNPPSSYVNFRSGLSSLFLVFLVVAQDGWVVDIMQPVIESSTPISASFFIAIIASMVFLVVNLFVAVITTSFMNLRSDSQEKKEEAPGYMGKMETNLEETQMNLIMATSLALEESMNHHQSSNTNHDDGNTAEDESKQLSHHEEKQNNTFESKSKDVRSSSGDVDEPLASGELRIRNRSTTGSVSNSSRNGSTALSLRDTPPLYQRASVAEIFKNLTVETTMEMIQNSATMEDFLLQCNNTVNSNSNVQLKLESKRPQNPNVETKKNGFQQFQNFVLSKKFDDFITICILLNTIFLLIEYPQMNPMITMFLLVAEYLFGIIFMMEMIFRIIAMKSINKYLRNTERFFDTLVVICTTINMVLNNLDSTGYSGLNSVSSLRTLRVSRLMLKYEGTRKLIQSVLKSSRAVLDVVAFMIFFQVVNSILAMQMFGNGSFTTQGEIPRWNFNTFGTSFLTLLQVITADQWSSIAYDAVDADNPHWFMVPFLILNFIVGQYIVLNLFIAVILENFSLSEEEAYQLQLEQILAVPKELQILEKIEEEGVLAFGEMDRLENVNNSKARSLLGIRLRGSTVGGGISGIRRKSQNVKIRSQSMIAAIKAASVANTHYRRKTFLGNINFLWTKSCINLAKSVWFARLVQFSILVSCIALALDEPHPEALPEPPSDTYKLILSVVNRVILFILFIEFVVKITLQGFGFEYVKLVLFKKNELFLYRKQNTYVENVWNRLDFFLLLMAIADEIMTGISPQLTIARVFRAGRVFRPLRILNQNKEMKLILNAVAQSVPHVGNVLALCSIVYIIFGVTGRSFFAGKLNYCNDSQIKTMHECTGFYVFYPNGAGVLEESSAKAKDVTGILVPRVWSSLRFSFDNAGSAFIALLEMTSLKWIDKAFAAMDITGVDQQPETNASVQHAIYFVLFVYIGSLFVIRLFVGVLVEQFQRNNGTQILTERQKCWVDLEKFILLLKPAQLIPRPKNYFRSKIYDIVQDEKFSTAISSAIMLNVVLMLANTTSPDQSTFRIIEMIFVSIFSLEALLKTISFGHHFFVSPSGLFELIILMGSLVAYFIGSNRYRIIVQAGRIFRMMRVARFIKLNRNVHIIFQTFRASLRPITNIFFLLFLIFFIFAIVGRQLFGGVKYGMQLNRFTNFRTFQSSFLVLFQIMSGDDWHLLMTDCMVTTPACSKKPGASDCGSPVGSVIYFITYVILVVFVFVNLFVTVVLENFRSCYIKDLCDISLEDFEEYRQLFARYDTTGQGNIPLWQLSNFLAELPEGLRIDASKNRASFLHIRSQAQALIDHDKTTSKQKPRTTISAAASAAKSSAKEAYTLWKDFMDGNNHRSNGTRREIAGQKTPFFNELLRILCIHHLGIRALPYEQQRDCVKQIFIYKEKVARMLVESIVRGYIIRWRQRRNKRMLLELSPHTSSTTTPEVVSQQVLKRKREIEMTAVHADATQVEEKGNNSCEKEKSTKPLSSSPKAANAHRNLEKMITVDESRPSIGGDAAISAAIVLVHSSQTAQETVTQNLPATSCKSTVTLPKLHHDVADADMDENHHDGHHHRRHKQKDNEGEDHIGHKKTKRREHHSKGKKRYESGASDEEHHNRPKRKHHSPQQRQNRDDSSCSSDENHKHSRDSHKHREDRQHKHFSQKDDQTDSSASSRVPFCPSLEQHQKSELSDKAELLDLGNVTSTPHQPQEVKTSNSIYSVMMKSASYTASKSQRSFLPKATSSVSTADQNDSRKHREHRQHKHFSQKDDQADLSGSSRVPFCPSLEQHQKSELSDKAELLDLGNVTSTPHQPQEVKTSNSIYSVMMKSASYTASKSQRSFLPQATFSTPDQKMDHTTVDIPVSEVVEKKISTGSPSKRQGKSSQVVPT